MLTPGTSRNSVAVSLVAGRRRCTVALSTGDAFNGASCALSASTVTGASTVSCAMTGGTSIASEMASDRRLGRNETGRLKAFIVVRFLNAKR